MARIINHPVEYNGASFDSREECEYFKYITDNDDFCCIHRQVRFRLLPRQSVNVVKHLKTKDKLVEQFLENPIDYTADFVYYWHDRLVICDVKSAYTHKFREWAIIRKLIVKRVLEQNKKRHQGVFKVIFREAIVKVMPKKLGGGISVKNNDKPSAE
jgi:hypothetical protein